MTVSKKFLKLASEDAAVKAELDSAAFKALSELLKAKGLEDEAAKALDTAVTAVAEAHGCKAEAMEELDEGELKAVAGGICKCYIGGGGSGTGKECVCFIGGKGENNSGDICPCPVYGYGDDD